MNTLTRLQGNAKAVMLNEGRGEPNSIWVFDNSALYRRS